MTGKSTHQELERRAETLEREAALARGPKRASWNGGTSPMALREIIGIDRGVTELERTRRALRESEEKFRNLANSSIQGIIVHRGFKPVFANRTMADILACAREEILRQETVLNMFHPAERARLDYAMREDGDGGKAPTRGEVRGLRKDGSDVWLLIETRPVRWTGGPAVQMTCFDVTERKRAEETLRESERRFRDIVNNAEVGIFQSTHDGKILMSNPRLARIFGFEDHEEFLTKVRNVSQLFVSPEGRAGFLRELNRKGFVHGVELQYLRKDGRTIWCRENARMIKTPSGETIYEGFVVDISERKEVEEKLRSINKNLQKEIQVRKEAEEKADAANRAKSEFLANMSHELRTPLNAVTGFSELLSSIVTDKKQKSYLKAIKTGGKSLLTLINDILDLSRIEAGRMEIQYASVNPRMIFDEIEQIFKLKIAAKNLRFIMEIDPDLPDALMLDETRLRQVLLNIVGNAVKFTEKGHVGFSVGMIEKNDDRRAIDLIMHIEDTGRGVSEKDQDSIFQAFRQQDGQDVRKYGGAGLGLAISRNLIELMNGEISLKSAPGRGAVFTIVLRGVGVAEPEAAPAREDAFDIENVSFKKAKALVVDDVESNRDFIRELLTRANLDVLTAENGQEAIILAGEYQPDVILMDIRMPVMNGMEAARLLKNYPETREIPVIALTASAKIIDRSELMEMGLDGYLSKPVSASALFGELSGWLEYTKRDGGDVPEQKETPESPMVDDIGEIPRLTRALKMEILPSIRDLRGVIKITEVTMLRKRMSELGKKYGAPSLIDYADRLHEVERSFNISEIEKTLSELPRLVEDLERAASSKEQGR